MTNAPIHPAGIVAARWRFLCFFASAVVVGAPKMSAMENSAVINFVMDFHRCGRKASCPDPGSRRHKVCKKSRRLSIGGWSYRRNGARISTLPFRLSVANEKGKTMLEFQPASLQGAGE